MIAHTIKMGATPKFNLFVEKVSGGRTASPETLGCKWNHEAITTFITVTRNSNECSSVFPQQHKSNKSTHYTGTPPRRWQCH
jgi:hypothetical protein